MKTQDKAAKAKAQPLNAKVAEIADPDQVVVLGKICSAYGLQGWLKIQSYTYPLENILDYADCLVGADDGRWYQFKITDGHLHSKGLVAHFEGYDAPETARALTNLFIAIPRDQLPATEADEYYWHDLVGLTVVNLDGQTLGQITRLFDTGPHDILVIEGEQEHMIPYVKDVFVKTVNMKEKTILVDWQPDSFTYR